MKVFILALFYVCFASSVEAANFNYTGNHAVNYDFLGFLPSAGPISVGGPGHTDDNGSASEFTVGQDVRMEFLNVNATVQPGGVAGTTNFVYKLYEGSTFQYLGALQSKPIPDINSLVLTSAPVGLSSDPTFDTYYKDFLLPFPYDLKAGEKYWLAQEGEGPTTILTAQSLVATPEPSSFVLFLVGAPLGLWVAYRRRFCV